MMNPPSSLLSSSSNEQAKKSCSNVGPSSNNKCTTKALPMLSPIASQLLNPSDWLQFTSKVNRLPFIDDEGRFNNCSTLMTSNSKLVSADRATTIAEARRLISGASAVLRQLSEGVDETFAKAAEMLLKVPGRVVVSGLSKGGHIERKLASSLATSGSQAFFLHPDDLTYHGELDSINKGDVFIILSVNGQIAELLPAVLKCERIGVPIIAITAKKRSRLGEAAKIVLEIPEVPETLSKTMTSAVCMMTLGDALAVCTQRARRGLAAGELTGAQSSRHWLHRSVKEVMSTDPLKIPAMVSGSSQLTDAIPKLLYSHAGLVGVVNNQGQLVDALTDGDIRLLAKSDYLTATVEEALVQANASGRQSALSLGHCVLLGDEQALDAVIKMSRLGLRGAFVVNDRCATIGYLSLADCIEAGILPATTLLTLNKK